MEENADPPRKEGGNVTKYGIMEKFLLVFGLYFLGAVMGRASTKFLNQAFLFIVVFCGVAALGVLFLLDFLLTYKIKNSQNRFTNRSNENEKYSGINQKNGNVCDNLEHTGSNAFLGWLVLLAIICVVTVLMWMELISGLLYSLILSLYMVSFLKKERWYYVLLHSIIAALIFLFGASFFGLTLNITLLGVMVFLVFFGMEIVWELSLGNLKYRRDSIVATYGEDVAGILAGVAFFLCGVLLLLLPLRFYGLIHVKVGAVFVAALFFGAYRLLLDPEKYAREVYLICAFFSTIMIFVMIVEGIFI